MAITPEVEAPCGLLIARKTRDEIIAALNNHMAKCRKCRGQLASDYLNEKIARGL